MTCEKYVWKNLVRREKANKRDSEYDRKVRGTEGGKVIVRRERMTGEKRAWKNLV